MQQRAKKSFLEKKKCILATTFPKVLHSCNVFYLFKVNELKEYKIRLNSQFKEIKQIFINEYNENNITRRYSYVTFSNTSQVATISSQADTNYVKYLCWKSLFFLVFFYENQFQCVTSSYYVKLLLIQLIQLLAPNSYKFATPPSGVSRLVSGSGGLYKFEYIRNTE